MRAHDYWSLLVLLSSWSSDTQLVGSGDGILILWPAQEIGQGAEWCELGWGAVAGAELPRSPTCCRKVNNFAEKSIDVNPSSLGEMRVPNDEWRQFLLLICGEDSQAQPSGLGFKLVRE